MNFYTRPMAALVASAVLAWIPAVEACAAAGPDDSPSYSWGLGIGGAARQQAYADIDRDFIPLPLLYFQNRWVKLLGPTLEVALSGPGISGEPRFSAGVRIEYDNSGYKPGDAPILDGMGKRSSSILAGPFARWSFPFFDVSAQWMLDAASKSKGRRTSIGLERKVQVGAHLVLTPSAAGTWLDRKYVDYYYGVRSAEARAGRPAHAAGSTVNTELALRTDYIFDQHQAVFLQLGHTALGSKIKASPLTGRSGETRAFLGYLYRFRASGR